MEESQDIKDKKKKNRRLKGTVLATAAAAGVLVNGLFGTPSDLLADPKEAGKPAAVILMESDTPIDEESSEDEDSTKKKKTLKEILAGWILELPLPIRILVCLPLWVIGWGICSLFGLLWAHLISPIWGTLSSWLLGAAVLFAVFVITMKTAFPQIPLKKLLRPKNAVSCVLVTIFFGLLVNGSILLWPELERFERLFHFASGLLSLGFLFVKFRLKEGKELFLKTASPVPAPAAVPTDFKTAEEFWKYNQQN